MLANQLAKAASPSGERRRFKSFKTAPAVKSKALCMHGGAKGSGAQRGNRNALKHGVFTKDSIELRATLRKRIREAQRLLKEIRD